MADTDIGAAADAGDGLVSVTSPAWTSEAPSAAHTLSSPVPTTLLFSKNLSSASALYGRGCMRLSSPELLPDPAMPRQPAILCAALRRQIPIGLFTLGTELAKVQAR